MTVGAGLREFAMMVAASYQMKVTRVIKIYSGRNVILAVQRLHSGLGMQTDLHVAWALRGR